MKPWGHGLSQLTVDLARGLLFLERRRIGIPQTEGIITWIMPFLWCLLLVVPRHGDARVLGLFSPLSTADAQLIAQEPDEVEEFPTAFAAPGQQVVQLVDQQHPDLQVA